MEFVIADIHIRLAELRDCHEIEFDLDDVAVSAKAALEEFLELDGTDLRLNRREELRPLFEKRQYCLLFLKVRGLAFAVSCLVALIEPINPPDVPTPPRGLITRLQVSQKSRLIDFSMGVGGFLLCTSTTKRLDWKTNLIQMKTSNVNSGMTTLEFLTLFVISAKQSIRDSADPAEFGLLSKHVEALKADPKAALKELLAGIGVEWDGETAVSDVIVAAQKRLASIQIAKSRLNKVREELHIAELSLRYEHTAGREGIDEAVRRINELTGNNSATSRNP